MTQYIKPLYKGLDFLPQTTNIILTSEKRNLSVKDKKCWSQNVLCLEVPLYYIIHTVFPRNLATARFYFKALFDAVTI